MNADSLVGAVDVHYGESSAMAALVVCQGLRFSDVVSEHIVEIGHIEPYVPGAFYTRELPCIAAILDLGPRLDLLVVDGYATLDPSGRPGLGSYASDRFGLPVIGVAKRAFRPASHAAKVVRGRATTPLHVTAAGGMSISDASRIVHEMDGPYRIPAALTRVDHLSRSRHLL